MIGKVIDGKYIIDSKIGSGGTANVYKAHSITNPNSFVAIKFLKEEFQNNSEYVRRFVREAQAGMQLIHPNIVKVIDTGVDDEVNYIVFEYIPGNTLKDYMASKGVFSEKSAANIVGNILDAIGYAHSNGIIHRDVKPQNVMLTSDGTIKLADFGIARVTTASTKSFSGTKIMGSVHYISPEQAAGKDIQYQSDLYSVGIILYEMLTGTLPYDNSNEISVALMHIKSKMEPPILRNPNISHALNAVILKATAKDINVRYRSAEEFKNDLFLALKQPDGTFADLNDEDLNPEDDGDVKTVGKLNRGIFNTMIIFGGVIFLMILAFIIINLAYTPNISVKAVIGKSVSDAKKILGNDFKVKVEYVTSDEDRDIVVGQEPKSDSQVPKNTTVIIKVSLGHDRTMIPDLADLTLSDALNVLSEKGLKISDVIYESNDSAKAGAVFKQSPEKDSEVEVESGVTLYISGLPQGVGIVPNVSDRSIDEAVTMLNEIGFYNIRVKFDSSSNIKSGNVFKQLMPVGLNIDTDTVIELSVSGSNGKLSRDITYNIKTESANESIVITIDSKKGYEIVVFETVADVVGENAISFTAFIDNEGEYDIIAYKSGVECRREQYSFTVEK